MYYQGQRADPDELELVSDNEPEDAMPEISELLSLLTPLSNDGIAVPTLPVPNLAPAETQLPPDLTRCGLGDANLVPAESQLPSNQPTHGSSDVNWEDVVVDPTNSLVGLSPTGQTSASPKLLMDWNVIRTSFLDADANKNEHKLKPTGIPDVLRMMMHVKLFILLSMLTTVSLSQICYNDNLKYKKIPFSYVAGKYTLDKAHFPPEELLSDAKYLQAHKHWLSLMKLLAQTLIYGGWRAHHDQMCDDPDMLKWSMVW